MCKTYETASENMELCSCLMRTNCRTFEMHSADPSKLLVLPLDIYWVILFLCEFLSTCRAAVNSAERVADALTAEKVAALCGDHEPTTVNDLEMESKMHLQSQMFYLNRNKSYYRLEEIFRSIKSFHPQLKWFIIKGPFKPRIMIQF